MPWWLVLGVELVKILIPIITKIINDPKPNKEAVKETVSKIKKVIHE